MKNVAVITGGSSGVGKEIARMLAKEGWRVYACSRSLEKGESDGVYTLRLDVTDEASVCDAVDYILAREGRIDALVNSAGFTLTGAIEDVTAEELHSQMDVNVYGALRMVRQVLPAMRDRQKGVIVNIGSVAGFVTVPFQGAYSMSKYALEAFNEALVMECSRYGIRSVIIDPGDMKTGFTRARRYTAEASRTRYRPYFDYAVHTMVKDEQKGGSPEACAKAAVKAITGKCRSVRIVVGFPYKIVNILRRLLPLGLTLRIANYVYSRPVKDDELWSFDRDVK